MLSIAGSMTDRPIIAFAGLIGSGKTTAAMHLVENHNFRRIRFAGPLKDMAYAFGLSQDQVDGKLKEEPCDLLGGKSPRQFMQLLGTEFGRNLIDPNLWIKAWKHHADQVPEGVGIVVDDCRFPNEADTIHNASTHARICRITRPGIGARQAHVSELQAFQADCLIENNEGLEELYRKVDNLVNRVINSHR